MLNILIILIQISISSRFELEFIHSLLFSARNFSTPYRTSRYVETLQVNECSFLLIIRIDLNYKCIMINDN